LCRVEKIFWNIKLSTVEIDYKFGYLQDSNFIETSNFNDNKSGDSYSAFLITFATEVVAGAKDMELFLLENLLIHPQFDGTIADIVI
jgi:hypothetical protein